jgi:hypothetical protein
MQLIEIKQPKHSFWTALKELGLPENIKGEFHDYTIPWVNRNTESVINKAVKNPGYVLLSKLMLFKDLFVEERNYASLTFTMAEFKAALQKPVKLWRGGGGVFDPAHLTRRTWVPFTTKRDRANTFSVYDGTYAMKAYSLPKRAGQHWTVELDAKLDDILLYLPHGMDDEVIVPKKLLKQAKVISQT